MTVRSATLLGALGLGAALAVGAARPARAQPAPPEQTAEQRAVILFEQARLFVKANHCDDAVPVFEASLKLQETVGSRLNIADCYEKMKRPYSALKSFRAAERLAHDTHDDREGLARDRAAALEPKISRLELDVPPECDLPGFELDLDGQPVAREDWGKPRPMDPGGHLLEANAPGKKRWTGAVMLESSGDTQRVAVPVLEDEMKIVRVPPQPIRGQRQRVIGLSFLLSGVGVAAVPGTIATVVEIHNSSNGRPGAVSLGIFSVAGAAIITGGIIFLTAPKPFSVAWRVAPVVGDRAAGLSLGAAW